MRDLATFLLLTAAMTIAIFALLALATAAIRWARRGSSAASFIGWALLLLGAGMNPQPPPQTQVEDASRDKKLKKDVGSGDPKT